MSTEEAVPDELAVQELTVEELSRRANEMHTAGQFQEAAKLRELALQKLRQELGANKAATDSPFVDKIR
jgi:protein involved in temperature-dependent protein secretion